jgi:hypothetical protein
MKTPVLVLLLAVFVSGCRSLSNHPFVGGPAPAGIEVQNDIKNTVMIVRTQRDGELKGRYVASGIPAVIPVCGIRQGGRIIVTALFYDKAAYDSERKYVYLGSAQKTVSVSLDGSYRFAHSWVIRSFRPATEMRRSAPQPRVSPARHVPERPRQRTPADPPIA